MGKPLLFCCSVAGCFKIAHGEHSVCWWHLVLDVIIFATGSAIVIGVVVCVALGWH